MSDLITKFQEKGERQAQSGANFVPESVFENIESYSPEQIDDLDFGVIRLDDEGKILYYSRYESEFSGVAKNEAMGKNFFYEVAPCTNNRLFLGSFQRGVEQGSLKIMFFYTFTYRMKPTYVKVFLFKRKAGDNWIFIKKMAT